MTEFNNGSYVLGRDLQKELDVKDRYTVWFNRFKKRGYVEGADYLSFNDFVVVNNGARRKIVNHKITKQMADRIRNYYSNKKSRQQLNHVYVMQMIGLDDYYKIGITHDVERRKHDLDTAAPLGVKVVLDIISDDTPLVEKYLHAYFYKFNSHGEWYKLSNDQLDELIKYLTLYEQIEKNDAIKANTNYEPPVIEIV